MVFALAISVSSPMTALRHLSIGCGRLTSPAMLPSAWPRSGLPVILPSQLKKGGDLNRSKPLKLTVNVHSPGRFSLKRVDQFTDALATCIEQFYPKSGWTIISADPPITTESQPEP